MSGKEHHTSLAQFPHRAVSGTNCLLQRLRSSVSCPVALGPFSRIEMLGTASCLGVHKAHKAPDMECKMLCYGRICCFWGEKSHLFPWLPAEAWQEHPRCPRPWHGCRSTAPGPGHALWPGSPKPSFQAPKDQQAWRPPQPA